MNWVKQNWGQLTFAGAALVGLHLFVMNSMINTAVETALKKQDLAKDSNIMAINTNVASNARTGAENAEDIGHNRADVRAAFTRLFSSGDEDSQ